MKTMRLYSAIITFFVVVIITLNAVFGGRAFGFTVLYCVLATVFGVMAEISLDIIAAFTVRALPEKWFSRDNNFFVMKKRERKFFEKLGIRKWKGMVPDLGNNNGGLCKRKLALPHDNNYIAQYLKESAYSQAIHIATVVIGFALVPLYPLEYWYCFGLPIAVVNAVLNSMSLFALRYNFGRLKILYMYNERKSLKRSQNSSQNSIKNP